MRQISISIVLYNTKRPNKKESSMMKSFRQFKNVISKYFTAEITSFSLISLAGLNFSLVNAFPGILIDQLRKSENDIKPPDGLQTSNIASLGVLTACIATFVAGFINDQFGRKCTITFSYVLSIAGWIMYYFSRNISEIYLARIASGSTIGFSGPLYQHVAEISKPSHRGIMLVGSSAVASFGYILVFCLSHLHYKQLCLIYGIYCVIACVAHQMFVLESPSWYVQRKRIEDAKRVLCKLCGSPKKAEQQLQDMLHIRAQDETSVSNKTSRPCERNEFAQNSDERPSKCCCPPLVNRIRLWKEKRVYKPFFILLFYMLLLPMNGVQFINCYPILFYEVFNTQVDAKMAAVIFSSVTFCANLINPLIIHKFRRRKIAICSVVLMFLTVSTLTVWQFYVSYNVNWLSDPIVSWVSIVLLSVYILTSSCGNSYMPWTMTSEILAQNARAYQIGLLSVWAYMLTFITTKIYFLFLNSDNLPYILAFFAATSFLCALYVYIFLPETYNKSLMEIEREFDS